MLMTRHYLLEHTNWENQRGIKLRGWIGCAQCCKQLLLSILGQWHQVAFFKEIILVMCPYIEIIRPQLYLLVGK